MAGSVQATRFIGYVEYEGDTAYVTPTSDVPHAEHVIGYVEYTLPSETESEALLGYVEYVDAGSVWQSTRLVAYVEYEGDSAYAAPTSDIPHAEHIIGYVEYTLSTSLCAGALMGYVEAEFLPPEEAVPGVRYFGPAVQ